MNRFEDLTDRQAECLRLLGGGLNAKQIAKELDLSYETVNSHLKAARRVLGVGRSIDAARFLLEAESSGTKGSDPQSMGTHPMVIASGIAARASSLHQVSPADHAGDFRDHELRDDRTAFLTRDAFGSRGRSVKGRFDDLPPARRTLIIILVMMACVVSVAGLAAIAGSLQAILWSIKSGH